LIDVRAPQRLKSGKGAAGKWSDDALPVLKVS
jgi:hypothetical protein